MSGQLRQIGFDELNGWNNDDHLAAMDAFLKTARRMIENPYRTKELGISSDRLGALSKLAVKNSPFDALSARRFYEENFTPCEIINEDLDQSGNKGFVTAYYEPEVLASRSKSTAFSAPLFARPDDLVDVTDENRSEDWDDDFKFAKMSNLENGQELEIHPDRGAINNGYFDGRGLEIAYVKDAVEALFIHIQGSARLRFEDGEVIRVGYAAKTGHSYTAVGKVLLDRGELSRENCGMQAIRSWFSANPQQMNSIVEKNRSYIFFTEYSIENDNDGPIGAAKVALTAGRSLAVDQNMHTYGTPIWIEASNPLPGTDQPFQKLMVAQDTGSAIVGQQRGDLFLGSGDGPGKIAGEIRHRVKFVVFVPNSN